MIYFKQETPGIWILVPEDLQGYSYDVSENEWKPFSSLGVKSFYVLAPGAEHFTLEGGRAVYVTYLTGKHTNLFDEVEDEEYHYVIGYNMHDVALMAGPELPSKDFKSIEIEELGDKTDYSSWR